MGDAEHQEVEVGLPELMVGGVYDVGAIHQHTRPVYALLHFALHRAVEVRADSIAVPSLTELASSIKGYAFAGRIACNAMEHPVWPARRWVSVCCPCPPIW